MGALNPPLSRRHLPIGIQTLAKIRERDAYYVDKTGYAGRLAEEGGYYFLSRPRRFGKSLFVDTLKELFEGNEALFRGLEVHPRWDWSARFPVLHLSFGGGHFGEPGYLHANVMAQLGAEAERAGIAARHDTAPERLRDLVAALHRGREQPVAILIDEYDKPILDALDAPTVARANRDYLRGLYATIKDCDAHIRFAFLTGVSKFSKVSLFSGLNNLRDITLDPRWSAICGYTEHDLDTVFAAELPGLDRDRIRAWYNGYSWRGADKVYNPFDILLLFDSREFRAHWFETGSPTFLVDVLLKRGVQSPALEGMVGSEDLLSRFDVDDIGAEALLFQTGYLTIVDERRAAGKSLFRLGYPNREVKQGLNEHLLRAMGPDPSRQGAHDLRLHDALAASDFEGMDAIFRAFFAGIPHEWHTNNPIANYEGWYASVLYSWFAGLGLDVAAEESTSQGRLDMAVRFRGSVFLFEFKVVRGGPTGAAMAQLKARGYADKYRVPGTRVHLIAVEFSERERNVASFEVERAGSPGG